ncbi:MAG: hypothetical protein CMM67_04400 [Rhodospirillaceae bacterium]|nr:hypothetical protein [Rhodospirillaceae bacterium]OUT78934.1 MAG: hypothetical protein CBB83_04585 [Rhodospirillaceae bacterium TMED23]|tara:strand:+ start:1274 stop:1714 length:441 start_codon:yes stop_codon:yes gene_type:complete
MKTFSPKYQPNKNSKFVLDQRLINDTYFITNLSLCSVLLMNDSRYPWIIAVPRRNKIKEIYELKSTDQSLLLREINLLAKTIKSKFKSDKINIGAIGNIVPQLHIHIVGRKENDPAWPAPVWGFGTSLTYEKKNADNIITAFINEL